jgi:hypothetical protein
MDKIEMIWRLEQALALIDSVSAELSANCNSDLEGTIYNASGDIQDCIGYISDNDIVI